MRAYSPAEIAPSLFPHDSCDALPTRLQQYDGISYQENRVIIMQKSALFEISITGYWKDEVIRGVAVEHGMFLCKIFVYFTSKLQELN